MLNQSSIINHQSSMTALLAGAALFAVAIAAASQENGVLDEHPSIQYATRSPTDPVATLNRALAGGSRTLHADGPTGYLRPLLDARRIGDEPQLLRLPTPRVQPA